MMRVLLVLLATTSYSAFADPFLWGRWKIVETRDGDVAQPAPAFPVYYEFATDGMDRMFWALPDGAGACERWGRFETSERELNELVVWVDPLNDARCAADVNMQLGRQSLLSYQFSGERLQIDFLSGQKRLTSLWEKQIVPKHGL